MISSVHEVRADERANAHRFASADLLRAVAIAAVVLDHLTNVLPYNWLYGLLATLGLWGVNCFFLLTGFLLAGPYLRAILDPQRCAFPSARLFYERRFFRIMPLYAFAVVCTGIAHGHSRDAITSIGLHLLFLQGFFAAYDGAPFGPLWTMAVDAQFYLVLPLIAYAIYRATRATSRGLRHRAIVATLASAVLISVVWRIIVAARQPAIFADYDLQIVLIRNAVGMASSFTLGVAFALVTVRGVRIPHRWCLASCAAGLLLLLPFTYLGVTNGYPTVIVGDLIGGLSALLLFGGLVEGNFPRLVRIARAPATRSAAALSYAVYLFHKPVIVAIHSALAAHGLGGSAAGTVVLVVLVGAVLGVVAVVVHRFVELPFLAIRDRLRETPGARRTRLPRLPVSGDPLGPEQSGYAAKHG